MIEINTLFRVMKTPTLYSALSLLILLICEAPVIGQCPVYGDASATNLKGRALNKAKNSPVKVPASWNIQSVPLSLFINSPKKNDASAYMNGAYAYTEGYITTKPEEKGPESCNCKKATVKKKNGDVHIYLGLDPNAPKSKCIVVEITPAYKKIHPDYINGLVQGQKVRVEGLLLFDFEHKGNAANTCKSCSDVWRKTCWEIHPITKITLEN